jgi:excisionase family DNA binding protein
VQKRAGKTTEKVFLRRKHAAEAASISLPVLDKLIREGRLRVVRVGRAVLIPRAALEGLDGVE